MYIAHLINKTKDTEKDDKSEDLYNSDINGLYFHAAAKQAVRSRRVVSRSSHLHHCNSWT